MKDFLYILKKIWLWAVIGLVIRLLLMPITFHPDLWAVSFSQYLFAYKGIINIYDYLANLPNTSILVVNYGQNFFTYPPLAYFTLGIFGFILKPFFNNSFFNNLAVNLPNILNDNRLYWHLFLTKLPYLFFDLGVLYLLTELFDDEEKKILISLLWIFNPLSLYTSYMMGQFDIIPVFFTVLALYSAKKKNYYWSAVSLGIGSAFKMYPLFFLPFLLIAVSKNGKNSIKLLLAGILPYLLTIAPFIGFSAFRQTVLFSNQSQKMLFSKIPVSGAEYLSVFVVFYVFLIALSSFKKLELWKWFLSVMLLFFSVTHYHPQWFLWVTPFLIIFWVEYQNLKIFPIILCACWFLIMIFFEPSLSIALFAPLFHSLSQTVPLSISFSRYYDIFEFKSLVRSVFAGTSLFLVWLNFRKNETEKL